MKIRPVKGTRDFYPPDMRLRNWICDAWRRVSLRNGFEEYDAPIFEYLDLFTIKSGQEIGEQLFSLTDRGGRCLAIRPEITPSLARMVNEKISSLPRPIKWFSIPRLCRAEKPQRGRLREFFQWNIDIIGSDEAIADAECIFVCADFLREIGLAPSDVQIRIGSRPLTILALKQAGIDGDDEIDSVLSVLDKRPRVTEAEFVKLAESVGLSADQIKTICKFQDCSDPDDIRRMLGCSEDLDQNLEQLTSLMEALAAMGVSDYCKLDMRIVRGLAYYTGIVYEIFDTAQSLRAVGGGGRYDNLLEVLGGPRLGATGFGMGDVVLGILLEEKGKLPNLSQPPDFFLVEGEEGARRSVLELAGKLRRMGLAAEFSYAKRSVGKQLKEADKKAAKTAVIVRSDGLVVKDLETGSQREMSLEEFLAGAK